jgi:hypothetical protein
MIKGNFFGSQQRRQKRHATVHILRNSNR